MSCRDICLILKDPWSTSGHVAHTDLLQQARFGTGTDCALHVRDSVPIRDCALHARFGTDCVHRRASRRSQIPDLRSQISDLRSQTLKWTVRAISLLRAKHAEAKFGLVK